MSKITIICLTLVRNVLKQVLYDSELRPNLKPTLRSALTIAFCILGSLINEPDDLPTLSAQIKDLKCKQSSLDNSSDLLSELNA